MSGCNSETTPAPTTNSPATTPAAASSAAPAPDKLSGTITEAGSTTVQPLAEKLANAFKAKNPDVNIVIQGGGSSVGIKSASAGTVDVGAASREVKEGDPPVQTFLLARDGIAIIVHPENTVDSLTKSQVRDIFAGTITNWKEVGGVDKEIHVVAREEGSGTRSAFQEMVMGKDDAGNEISIIKNAILQSSNGAVMQVVKGDAQSISFVSFGYVESTVKAVSIDGIEATSENAKSGTYPIVRPLYFLTKDNPTGLVKAFFDYCASDEAKQIIVSEGYIVAN
ncbi:MAG: phosphate ABC transporter substrate-binding protein [Dehalococcoidales bacterium]|nr:phosphate ABC transporter substrate-binding protein [Dehalococcoidales bacterium]